MLQFKIAFFEPDLFRHEHAVISHFGYSENDPTFPNKVSSAGEFLPADPYPKDD